MSIFQGSRYLELPMVEAILSTGESARVHQLRETTIEDKSGMLEYVTKAGDTFESIASQFYGDGNKWFHIADANPEVFFPLDLIAGVQIYVPSIAQVALK